jgi:hypothetical protein
MARRYGEAVEALRRVDCALAYHAARLAGNEPMLRARQSGPVMLEKEPELAARFSPEQLREMAANLQACVERHHKAMVKGYGDALRTEPERRKVRAYHVMLSPHKYPLRMGLGFESPPDPRYRRSERETNGCIARALGKANESVVRRLLGRKGKWIAWEAEPRVVRKPKKHDKDK